MFQKFNIAFIFLFLISFFCDAQYQTEWEKVYGGMGNEQADVVFQTSDECIVAAGRTSSIGKGEYDGWIVKLDAKGAKLWDKTFGGNKEDVITAAVELKNGNWAFAGYTRSFGKGGYDLWFFIVDKNGNKIKETILGTEKWDIAYSMSLSSDGYIYIAGTMETDNNDFDFWLLKMDSDAKLIWSKKYGSTAKEKAFAVYASNTEIVIGGSSTNSNSLSDFYILCLTPDGKIKWESRFGQKTDSNIRTIIPAFGGGYFIGGYTTSAAGVKNVTLARIDENGRKQWEKVFGGINDDMIFSAVQLPQNRYGVCGYSSSKGEGGKDGYLLITDDYGNQISEQTFGGIRDDKTFSIVRTLDNAIVIAGFTSSGKSEANDLKLIKLREQNLDNKPPEIKWLSPTHFTTPNVKVRAQISSNVQFALNQEGFVQLNSFSNAALGDNVYEFSLKLKAGKNLVNLIASNAAGTTNKQIEVYLQKQIKKPLVQWIYPNHEITTTQKTLRVKVKIISAEQPEVLVSKNENSEIITVNATPKEINGEFLYDFIINLVKGDNNIHLKATNTAGSDVKTMLIKAL